MKLFLFVPYIISLATGKFISDYNHTIGSSTFDSSNINIKECYQCNFDTNTTENIIEMLHNQCKNYTIKCENNNFCSTTLANNQYNTKYRLQLGCLSENYCSKVTEKNIENDETVVDNYSNCCESNLCNNETTVKNILPFNIEKNNTNFIRSVVNHQRHWFKVIPILNDFKFTDHDIDKHCINEAFFTDEDNLIITLKKNICNNKKISENNIPFSISQPINKIIFLDIQNQRYHNLLSSYKGISSFNYIRDKNLLFFISDNYVFIYQLDKNKQLIKINQFYFADHPVDIAINYNSKIIAIADKYKVLFYDIEQIEQIKEIIPIQDTGIGGSNIYKIQYAPNQDILLVETQDKNNFNTAIYNIENLNDIKIISITAPLEKKVKEKYIQCLYQSWRYHQEHILIRKHKIQDAKNYYGKWIISPSGDFIMKQKITPSCPGLLIGSKPLLRNDLYPVYSWCQANRYGYSVSNNTVSNAEMFISEANYNYAKSMSLRWAYAKIWLTDILAVYDYFFSDKNNHILAFIAEKYQSGYSFYSGGYRREKYLFLENISTKDITKPYRKSILQSKKLMELSGIHTPYRTTADTQQILKHLLFRFSQAHSGSFNSNGKKLAIFSDNRIQIYYLYNIVSKEKTDERKTTQAPERKTTQSSTGKSTRLEVLFPSLKKNISLLNNYTYQKTYNEASGRSYIKWILIGSGVILGIVIYTGGITIYYRYKYNKLKEKFIVNNHFPLIPLK